MGTENIESAFLIHSPEACFLRCCLVARHFPPALTEAANMSETDQLNWELVWSMAVDERCAGLLYHVTQNTLLLPPELASRAHFYFFQTGLDNIDRLTELARVIRHLQAENIDVVALKGAALAEHIYGNLALRPMRDVDILVRRSQSVKALQIMQTLGYCRSRPELAPNTDRLTESELLLHHPERAAGFFELHWALFDSPYYADRPAQDVLWTQVNELVIRDTSVLVLAPEMQLLHLCGHLMMHHDGHGLLWWQDIVELLNYYADELDWTLVAGLAQKNDLVLSLRTVLSELQANWYLSLPDEAVAVMHTLVESPNERRVFEQMNANRGSPAARLTHGFFALPGWRRRLRFFYHNVFPSGEYMDQRYGIRHPLYRPFYYIKRWLIGLASLRSWWVN